MSGAALHRKEAGCGDGGGHVWQFQPPVCELQERADCGIFNTQSNLALGFLLLWLDIYRIIYMGLSRAYSNIQK